MFKDIIVNAKGDLLFSNCDVPVTVYFVLLTLNVSMLFLNQLLMCFNSDIRTVWILCTLLLEKKALCHLHRK